MSLRYTASKFKGLAYGPKETLQYFWSCLNGTNEKLVQEALACTSVEDHWQFARKHFYPCQKPVEILRFLKWGADFNPETVVEIGVAMGGTTYLLANGIPSVKKVIGVDFFPRNRRTLKKVVSDRVRLEFVTGSSVAKSTIEQVDTLFEGKKVDLLLIDGDHAYEAALNDYKAYRPLVREGGWIAFHDILPPEADANGKPLNGFPMEVHQLWNELKGNYESREFVEDQNQFSYGIGVIQV